MKIGIVGGSFDPPHKGHIYISLQSKKRLKLNQIWWIPTKQNPLKHKRFNDFNTTVNKCREISSKHPEIKIKDYEKLLKNNYTIDLIKRIKKKYPTYQFFWIMGADSLINFHLWEEWKEIIRLSRIIIIDREEYLKKALNSKAFFYLRKLKNKQQYYILRIKKYDISSTKIRNNIM